MRCKYGEYWGHHRGLRPGHLFKVVVRELGRAESFPVRKKVKMEKALPKRLQAMFSALLGIESIELMETQR